MDSHNRSVQSESSEDEEEKFTRYMDDNGIIGLEEDGNLELDYQAVLELEEDEEPKMLDLGEEEMVEPYEGGLAYPESMSEGEGSGNQSLKEEFSFSPMLEERSFIMTDKEALRKSEITISRDENDHSSVEQPSMSVTLPSALGRRPPSRDQQLDMTEDEVDRGSSLGAWEGDEEENWKQEPSEFLDDESPGNGKFGKYEQTSAQGEQWNNNPGAHEEDFYENQEVQEDEVLGESLSPSSPPIPSTWGTRLMSHFGRLSLSPRIEDETLPESSCTDSVEHPGVTPARDPTNISSLTKVSKQDRMLRPKPTRSSSPSLRNQHADDLNVKKTKRSNISLYGKGQLNYPLPDLSKVGPRVRFPRDEQSYHPPQPRKAVKQSQGAPVIFKSPADIVKEVLLSSTEKNIQEPVIPPSVPQEFKTPQQATQLVHQLQEDYHKLLTKYAEAENTIDRLRLGAKVHLYSDPAQPSHSVQMGTVFQGSKVMEFTIPHVQTATITPANAHHGVTAGDTDSLSPAIPAESPTEPTHSNSSGLQSLHPPEDITSTLMSHLETLHQEVELFEELLHGGNLTPEEQRQAVRELRGSLDVLERRYLKAQEQYRQEQRHIGTGHPPKELDPQRELGEVIFQLGVQLDELQERVHSPALSSPNSQLKSNPGDTVTTHHLGIAPVPSAVVPVPALQTPYPQVSSPEPPGLSAGDVGALNKEDPAEYLPQPLRHKHMQVERDYGTLLSTYSSFKSLPDVLGVEQDEWPQPLPQNARPHDPPLDVSSQGQPARSQNQAHGTRSHQDPMTSGRPQVPQGDLQAVSPQDDQAVPKTKQHSHRAYPHRHSKTVTLQSSQPAGSSTDNLHESRPTSGTSDQHSPSPTDQGRKPSVASQQRTSPDEGKYSVRRTSQGSESFPQLPSMRSPVTQLREQYSSTPKGMLSINEEEDGHGAQSRKNSSSSKSVSPSAQIRMKGNIAQRRILSPETDSGFLGSESGRSPLQKQRHPTSLTRDHPAELPNSSANSPLTRGRQPSKAESDHLSGARKPLWEKRKQNGHWTGPSEASSPSPGPKSLTESESRESSEPVDESDSEQEVLNDVIADPSFGASPFLSPTEELSQPDGNIVESRTARDQAISDLQNEVIQLRQHLESSLHRSPMRGTPGSPAANQKLHEGKACRAVAGLGSPVSRRGAATRLEDLLSSSESRGRNPTQQASPRERGVWGPYTGSRYQLPGSSSPSRAEHVTVPLCQRCQEAERENPVSMKTSRKDERALPLHPACPLCLGNNDSDNTPRSGMAHGASDSRPHHRRRRRPHRIASHAPPVSYIQAPIIPYSPPVMYGTSPSLYVPYGYNVAELRAPYTVTSPPKPDILELEDLSWPLNRALEAAKELKVTSRRMCRSLTMDLSTQRSLRCSCLF